MQIKYYTKLNFIISMALYFRHQVKMMRYTNEKLKVQNVYA